MEKCLSDYTLRCWESKNGGVQYTNKDLKDIKKMNKGV